MNRIARTFWTLAFAAAVAASGASAQRGQTPCAPQPASALPASRDLYCIELTPVPRASVERVDANLELNRIPSPFGTNVTRDGVQLYGAVAHISGLPTARSFDSTATLWVAWLATPLMHPVKKLGRVDNGSHALGNIDWPKFVVLVTAEKSLDVAEPTGRLALRGFSPSSRMQPPDMMEFLYGTARADTTRGAGEEHGAHAGHEANAPASATAQWIHPPMPRGLAMMPAEMRLPNPSASPFLPLAAASVAVPDAKPREVIRAQNGDTIVLTAGLVRQTIRGKSFVGYGYNGQVPGPIISAPEGATVHVRYRNRIDWPSTVHWHGVRLANRFDGVPGTTQAPVPPNGDFDYEIALRDAGLFWYHPHLREDVLKDLGLYGNLMVRAQQVDYAPANREEFVMLDDIEIADAGLVPYGRERATHALMGRFGNQLLVNGRADWSLAVQRGEVVRFFLTNVTNARTFNVSFGAARIKVLGSDISSFERPEWVPSVVIAPAERYIVDVRFAESGKVAFENRVTAIDHTFGNFFEQVDTLGMIEVGAGSTGVDLQRSFETVRPHARVIADIDKYRRHFDRPVDKKLVVRMEAKGLPFVIDRFLRFDSVYFHPVEWSGTMPMMNWNSTSAQVSWILEDPADGKRNMDIRWDFKVGDVVKIRIANLRTTLHGMQHPIHFHGQRFLVLDQNGVRNSNLAWKDTFLLPAGSTADILLEISNPGSWMAHCHVSEHMESGMMMTFTAR